MGKTTSDFEYLRRTLEHAKGKYLIMEEQISVHTQSAYFKYSQLLKKTEMRLANLDTCWEELFHSDTDLDRKKLILSSLGASCDVANFRHIEEYLKNPDPTLRDWAILSKYECSLHLQRDLSNQNMVFVSSGLGGNKDKLRYIVVFYPQAESFEAFQRKLVVNESERLFKKQAWDIEEMYDNEEMVKMQLLIPLPEDIKFQLKKLIQGINEFGNFLSTRYIITNSAPLSNKQISKLLKDDAEYKAMD